MTHLASHDYAELWCRLPPSLLVAIEHGTFLNYKYKSLPMVPSTILDSWLQMLRLTGTEADTKAPTWRHMTQTPRLVAIPSQC